METFFGRMLRRLQRRRELDQRVLEEIGYMIERHGESARDRLDQILSRSDLSPRRRTFLEKVRKGLSENKSQPFLRGVRS